jgi:multifunctional methyltransferase subunit TRM112
MRLLTHNTLRNNTEAAKAGGFPLKITVSEIRVDEPDPEDDPDRQVAFVTSILSILDWPALVQAASDMGLSSLPPTLTEDMSTDENFLRALYHMLLKVHLVKGMLTCPTTGREFPVTNGIANFMLEEDECEHVRMN